MLSTSPPASPLCASPPVVLRHALSAGTSPPSPGLLLGGRAGGLEEGVGGAGVTGQQSPVNACACVCLAGGTGNKGGRQLGRTDRTHTPAPLPHPSHNPHDHPLVLATSPPPHTSPSPNLTDPSPQHQSVTPSPQSLSPQRNIFKPFLNPRRCTANPSLHPSLNPQPLPVTPLSHYHAQHSKPLFSPARSK